MPKLRAGSVMACIISATPMVAGDSESEQCHWQCQAQCACEGSSPPLHPTVSDTPRLRLPHKIVILAIHDVAEASGHSSDELDTPILMPSSCPVHLVPDIPPPCPVHRKMLESPAEMPTPAASGESLSCLVPSPGALAAGN